MMMLFKPKPKGGEVKRKELKDVRAGDTVNIYWNNEQPCFGVEVINNDPATKRILLAMHFVGEKGPKHKPYSYNHDMFKDFHLMNGGGTRSDEELTREISQNIKELGI